MSNIYEGMQLVLYGGIAVVAIVVIGVGYWVWRKVK